MRSEVLTDFSRLERMASEWDRIWNTNPQREIFTKFAWTRAWWRAYHTRRSLCAPAVFEGNRLVGVLPVVAEGRTLRFLGAPFSDYNDLLSEPDHSLEVLETALGALSTLQAPWERCVFDNISESSKIVRNFKRLPPSLRSRLLLIPSSACPTVVLDGRRRETLGVILSKKSLRRHQNNLQKRGKLVFRHLEEPSKINFHLPTLFQQHIARWAMAGCESEFSREETRAFYYALVEELDARNELRFSVLELNEQPIAYHLGFELNGKFIFYKPTFDIDLWAEWPGEVLIRHLFDYAASRGIREFDFTGGDEAYKYRFANEVRRNYTLHLYPPGPRGLTLRVCKTVEERAKARLRRNPPILQAFKAGISVSKRIGRSSRSALQVGTLRRLGWDVITRAFRTAVFAREDLLVFSCGTEVRAAADGNLKIWSSRLAELASLSLQHPDFLDVRRLHIARERLKQGDVAYVAKDGVGPLHVVWIGTRNEVAAPEIDPEWRLELDDSVSLVYDYWTPPAIRGGEISPSVLRKLIKLEAAKHRQLWISCPGDDFAARNAIETAGFRLRYRMGRVQLMHWFSRTWVQ